MRLIERIDNFLNKVDWQKLNERWEIPNDDYFGYTSFPIYLSQEWKKVPDQRFGQFMINRGDIPDILKAWVDEEEDILEAQGLPPEEYLFWGSNYDKDMNQLPETIYRLIKDLDSSHINAIYDFVVKQGHRVSIDYRVAFKNTLLTRNESIDHIQEIEDKWDNITKVEFE
jgi:hypothetical protein